jgi:hypothetical protein
MTQAQTPPFELRGGPGAVRHVTEHGLRPFDIACIPAAAGGPKGLALLPFDRLLAQDWLLRNPRIELVGASVGAWRMTALAQRDPVAALDRVEDAYVNGQSYAARPTPLDVSRVCRGIARAAHGTEPLQLRAGVSLSIITARARGRLHDRESRLAFGLAVMDNALGRKRLARYLERVVFQAGAASVMLQDPGFDEFGLVRVPLDPENAEDALLASGTIPLLAAPVRDIPGAPAGNYWDGALIDYHLLLPYSRLSRERNAGTRLVLYPHFNNYVTPGWLDKHLPWRREAREHAWLDDVLLIAPTPAFVATLPNGKLPDRQDFYRYGADHAARIRAWKSAIAQCGRMAEAAMRWLERPDPTLIKPI